MLSQMLCGVTDNVPTYKFLLVDRNGHARYNCNDGRYPGSEIIFRVPMDAAFEQIEKWHTDDFGLLEGLYSYNSFAFHGSISEPDAVLCWYDLS